MTRDDDFLSRWSRRKHASNRGEAPAPAPEARPATPATAAPPVPEVRKEQAPLPPVEALTPESDFTPFMHKEVDPLLRRQALRTLFRDPRFNIMDGLDVYIDDYSKPDPIPPEWLGKLNQMARLGDYKPPEEPPARAEEGVATAEGELIQEENQDLAEAVTPPSPDTSAAGSSEQESQQS